MMLPENVLKFANTEKSLEVFERFGDYFNHYLAKEEGRKNVEYDRTDEDGAVIKFEEKEELMNELLRKEIFRRANISEDSDPKSMMVWSNPQVVWASFAITSMLVDMVLPSVIIDSIGLYTDVVSIGWGDSASFEIEPRDLFVVSKAGRAQRTAEAQMQHNGQVTVIPENRQLTVQVSLYKVLSGKASLAKFVMKVVRSMEAQLTKDVYTLFNTTMEALDNAGDDLLRIAGYSESNLVSLGQKVSAFNGGRKAVICGTQAALANILPSDANYRYDIASEFVKIGYIKEFKGFEVMVLPQVASNTTDFQLALDDNNIYILSPAANKLIKLVLEGETLSNIGALYGNANLTQEATMYKSWGTGVATNAIAAIITLS